MHNSIVINVAMSSW